MSLDVDAAAIAAAYRIREKAGARVHRLGEPEELKEDIMPKKASTEPTIVKVKVPVSTGPKKRGRKPGVKYATKAAGPRFGVFDDGSVTVNLAACKGQIAPDEAREFLAFLAKIGVKA